MENSQKTKTQTCRFRHQNPRRIPVQEHVGFRQKLLITTVVVIAHERFYGKTIRSASEFSREPLTATTTCYKRLTELGTTMVLGSHNEMENKEVEETRFSVISRTIRGFDMTFVWKNEHIKRTEFCERSNYRRFVTTLRTLKKRNTWIRRFRDPKEP